MTALNILTLIPGNNTVLGMQYKNIDSQSNTMVAVRALSVTIVSMCQPTEPQQSFCCTKTDRGVK